MLQNRKSPQRAEEGKPIKQTRELKLIEFNSNADRDDQPKQKSPAPGKNISTNMMHKPPRSIPF